MNWYVVDCVYGMYVDECVFGMYVVVCMECMLMSVFMECVYYCASMTNGFIHGEYLYSEYPQRIDIA